MFKKIEKSGKFKLTHYQNYDKCNKECVFGEIDCPSFFFGMTMKKYLLFLLLSSVLCFGGARNSARPTPMSANTISRVLQAKHQTGGYGPTIGDGSGDSKANAINIDDGGALYTLSQTSADFGKYFLLTDDIDFEGTIVAPVGDNSTPFTGTFDGNGHTLSNGVINDGGLTNKTALFRDTSATATIKNLTVRNFHVEQLEKDDVATFYSGVLVGETTFGSVIERCRAIDCTVRQIDDISTTTHGTYIGGLVGASHGNITDSHMIRGSVLADKTALGNLCLGGLVGVKTGAESGSTTAYIKNCTSSAYVGSVNDDSSVTALVGGIAGDVWVSNTTLANYLQGCAFNGDINFTGDKAVYVGGIIGQSNSLTKDCKTSGSVYGETTSSTSVACSVGGIAGVSAQGTYTSITNCHGTGTVTGKSSQTLRLSGIVALHYDAASNCSFDGEVHYISSTSTGYIGGCCGSIASGGTLDNCYADVDLVADSVAAYLGGIAGYLDGTSSSAISNCYATGTVLCSGSTTIDASFWGGGVGGIANAGIVSYCYSAIGPWAGPTVNREGFIGVNSGTVKECLWDTDVAGHTTNSLDSAKTIDGVNTGTETFTLSGDGDLSATYSAGGHIYVDGSTGNDGEWVIDSVNWSDPDFTITVTGDVTDATVDGTISVNDGTLATSEELMDTTFLGTNAGTWDFTGNDRDWKHTDNYDYPRLIWE
jgi:hypothetical protein